MTDDHDQSADDLLEELEAAREERNQLRQQVDDLQSTVQKMMPSRRQFLKAGGTAAALGAAGLAGYGTGQAEAAQGDRGIGSPDDYWPAAYIDYGEFNTVSTEESRTGLKGNTKLPVVQELDRHYDGAVVDDTGTHFALHDDGSDVHVYRGDKPWAMSVVSTFGGASNSKLSLHKTASGTLIAGVDGIQRSTDDGESFSQVKSDTGGGSLGSISENSSGTIRAVAGGGTGGGASLEVYESTDDGNSWSVFADGTDFSNFNDHVHRGRFLKNNDNFVVTGGDGTDQGWYEYDGSWSLKHVHTDYDQMVAVGVKPGDDSYLLGTDTGGQAGWVFQDDGSKLVALEQSDLGDSSGAYGTFGIVTLHNPNGRSVFMASNINSNTPYTLAASHTLRGMNWKWVANAPDENVAESQKAQGPYESIIDVTNADVEYVIHGGYAVRVDALLNPAFGQPLSSPDTRSALADRKGQTDTLVIEGDIPRGLNLYGELRSELAALRQDGEDTLDLLYNNGEWQYVFGNNIKYRLWSDGGYRAEPQDLSNLSLGGADDGKTYNHNGASSINADGGTTSAKGVYVWSADDGEFKTVTTY